MPFEIFYCDMLVSTIPAMQYWLAKQSLKQIKLYFIALYTKQLIKEARNVHSFRDILQEWKI